MKNKILKNEKGYTAADALIAIFIITLFTGLIATISYNIYVANSSIKRSSEATNYIIDVFEYADKTPYEEVTTENLIEYFNSKYYYENDGTTVIEGSKVKAGNSIDNIDTPFKVLISVIKFNETEGNTDKLDVVKEITMTVKYTSANKEQEITMSTIKQK